MPRLELGGRTLYYEEHGEGEPLLCVHGLAMDTLGWMLQLPAWSTRYRTIVFDNRDVGQSSYAEAPYTITDMAADAIALADALELDSFHLLGVSMGGEIAQEMALAIPERVRTLTLCVTFAGGGRWAVEKARLWARESESTSLEHQVENLLLLCLSESFYENADAVGFLRQMILANPNPQRPEGFRRQLLASGGHEARDRLAALTMPVHVVAAEEDLLVPAWKSRELAELVPGAKLTVIPGAAHGVNLEEAEEFNAAVLDFLGSVAAPAA